MFRKASSDKQTYTSYIFGQINDKCNELRTGHSEIRTGQDYRLARDKSQESTSERVLGIDIVPSLSPAHQISKLLRR